MKIKTKSLKQTTLLSKTKIRVYILLILLGTFICSRYCYQLLLIDGNSMYPTYNNHQFVLIDKISKDYCNGDVIVFNCDSLNSLLVKRTIGIPGDTVCITNHNIVVNGNVYLPDLVIGYAGLLSKEIKLKDNEYLVIGDNVAESIDSRYQEVGIVYSNQIIGKVISKEKK